jgi:(heptosyl)LPS beta-1,4-glucosyltransferase
VPTLAAVILTRNESAHIAACIASLSGWIDCVVVWDSGSTDDTCKIARDLGAQVIYRPFDNFAAQRQAALDTVQADWIFFVDADERTTPALAAEVRAVIAPASGPPAAGVWVPRRNFIAGHETRGGGYYPDYQLRLLKRGAAHYVPEREVHEIVEVDGQEGYLTEPLLHYNYANWGQFHAKQRVYAAYEARILAARGIRPRPHNFILQPLREFRRRYFTLAGWRDGLHGLRLAAWLAWYYGFTPYWLLLQAPNPNDHKPGF